MGTNTERKLGLKAAQTWFFLQFLVYVLERVVSIIEGAREHLTAARSLVCFVKVFQSSSWKMTGAQQQAAWDAWLGFCDLTDDYLHLPKKHLTFHLLDRLPWFGNPSAYANWADESANLLLKKCCRQISQQTFETVLLQQMRVLLDPRGVKRSLQMDP